MTQTFTADMQSAMMEFVNESLIEAMRDYRRYSYYRPLMDKDRTKEYDAKAKSSLARMTALLKIANAANLANFWPENPSGGLRYGAQKLKAMIAAGEREVEDYRRRNILT